MWCPCPFSVKSDTVMLPLPRSPSALLLSHTPQKTLVGGPAHTFKHGLVSVDIRRGKILLDTTIVVSRSNKSASVSVGWLNHICYQYHVAQIQLSLATAQFSICLEAQIQFSSLLCYHPKQSLFLGIVIQVSIFILTIHIFLFYSLFDNILALHGLRVVGNYTLHLSPLV